MASKTKITFSTVLNDTKTVLSMIVVLMGLVIWTQQQVAYRNQELALIKADINKIQNNELIHVQAAIDEVKDQQDTNTENIQASQKALIRIETLLNQLVGDHIEPQTGL